MRSINALQVVSALFLTVLLVLPAVLAVGTSDVEPRVKVLVWTENPTTVSSLKHAGVTVLEEYGAFALVRGKSSTLSTFDVMKTDYNLDTVDLLQYVIDQKTGEPTLPKGLGLGPDGYGFTGHYIVQFYGPIKQSWLDELASKGAVVGQYLPSNAYIVMMDQLTAQTVASDPKVQYVGYYQPAYKVQQGLLDLKGTIEVTAVLFNDNDIAQALMDIQDLAFIMNISTTTRTKVNILMDSADLPKLASMDAVYWVELHRVWVRHSDVASWIEQSGVQSVTPLYAHGIHGENQTEFNSDTGIWVSHDAYRDSAHSVQFSTPGSNNAPDNQHRKIVNYWTFADNTDMAGAYYHGTHTNGVIAGDSTPNGGTFKGIAYAAKVSFGDIWYSSGGDGIPADLNNLFIKGFNDGARVSSNSWGLYGSSGIYDAQAQEVDEFMYAHKEMQILFSAGNDGPWDGTVSTPSTAKDVMSIGAGAHDNNGDMMGYSSRGPTDDGRLKPDIYTPTDEIGPCGGPSCSDSNYASAGGTSNSCPAATGGMALLRQYYTDGFYPSGTKKSSDEFNPTSALMRATVVNGAIEKQGTSSHDHPYNSMPFPNNDQGWGYMNLDNVLFFSGDTKKLYIDDHTTGLSTGETVDYYFNVIDSAVPLEITLAWTDPAGQTGAGTELVNNLDMLVTGPTGTQYKGNVWRTSGSPHESASGGSADAKNTIENFMLMTPATGGYSVKITATNIAQDTQPFGFVTTGNYVRDPDLALLKAELTVAPAGIPMEGDNIWFNGTVHNYGGLVAQLVPFEIQVDGQKVKDISFDMSLVDLKVFNFNWTAKPGVHTFKFIVDPLDIINEADENNNQVNVSIWANAKPRANLTLGPDKPLTLETVTADASLSTDDGFITWYKFDFGDGFKTNWVKSFNSTHQYKNNGFYNVTAWVKDNMSVISEPVTLVIEVLDRPPVANLSAAVYQAYTYFDISLDGAKSYDPDGTVTLLWDFGDSTTSVALRPVHNWTENGVYEVKLKVTDDDGNTDQKSIQVTILNQDPTSTFTTNVYRGNVTTKFEFEANGQDKDGTIAEWVWDFGDGNKSDQKDPTHNFGDDGEFNVSFYVLDNDGAKSAILNRTVIIDNLAPDANFTSDKIEALTYENIEFTDTSKDIDGRIITRNWDMGDGKVLKDAIVTHQFKENGVYSVKLTVQDDDDAISTKELIVTINNRPPIASAFYNATAYVGELLVLAANGSTDQDGIVKLFRWTFNGTENRLGQTITYAFWEPGVHNFTLTITDNDGAHGSLNLSITIKKKPVPKPPILGGGMDPFMLLLLIILIGCIVGAIIGAVIYNKRKAQRRPGHPGAEKVASVPLTTSMDIDSASAGKSGSSEQGFESSYQSRTYGKVEAYPFYAAKVESEAPPYDYGPGYDSQGTPGEYREQAYEPVADETAVSEEEPPTEAEPTVEEQPPEEEEEIPIKPVVVEHETIEHKVAEPEKQPEPETQREDLEQKAKEKKIAESDDLDSILSMLNDAK